jgi:hypothetical protein
MNKPAEAQMSKLDENNVKLLIHRYKSLQTENELLTKKLKEKNDDLINAHAHIFELRQNNADLMLARSLGATEEERRTANRRLAKMMREIDKCIALLIN